MTENMKNAISAINKFIFFSLNYKSVLHEFGEKKYYVPEFLVAIKWGCDFEHICKKWDEATDANTPEGYLPAFYSLLDVWNRRQLLEWVMINFIGEPII